MDKQYLITSIHPRMLREFLHQHKAAGRRIWGSFQDRPESLKQPLVIGRIIQLMDTDPDFYDGVCELWRTSNDELMSAIVGSPAAKLRLQLADLATRFGRPAVHCALELDGRKAVRGFAKQVQQLETPGDGGEPQPEVLTPSDDNSAGNRGRDKEAAKRDRARIHELSKQVEQLRGALSRSGKSKGKAEQESTELRDQVEKLKKRLHNAARLAERYQDAFSKLRTECRELRKQQRRTGNAGTGAEHLLSVQQVGQNAISERDWPVVNRLCAELIESASATESLVARLLRDLAKAQISKEPPPRAAKRALAWRSDGTHHERTPEQVIASLKRNDEELVNQLRSAHETISEGERERWRQWLREVDATVDWYGLIKGRGKGPIIVDGSNIARHDPGNTNHGKLAQLLTARRTLYACGYFPVLIYVDASLARCIDQPNELTALCDRGEVEMALAGKEADEWIILEARERGCAVITNDRMLDRDPDDEVVKCGFEFHGKEFVLKA